MTAIETLKITRQGEFPLHTYGKNHCGTAKFFKVRYHMVCLCTPKLDYRGFEFDQLNIDGFFQRVKRTSMSCERLTEVNLHRLRHFILAENPGCEILAINLTLSPAPYAAAMTASWAKSKEFEAQIQ